MSFIQVTIEVPSSELRDIVIAQLSEVGFDGFEERENELLCSVAESNFQEKQVKIILSAHSLSYSKSIIKEQNWNQLWESNFEPVLVDDFCLIHADFHEPVQNIEHDIIITPKMSFGTGHHATTYMMVQQMRDLDFAGKAVADFGTGTGILAILAEKLGAKSILAIDEDDWSIENAEENIARNNCNRIQIFKANSFNTNQKFEIILANINKNVILDNLESLVAGLQTGGQLLLSGLLQEDEADIVKACTNHNLKCINVVERNNWISILFEI